MNLHWDPAGPARGRVALLHGMMSTAATWWRIGPALAGMGWTVDALDLPGHGDWPRPTGPLDLDRLVEGVTGRLGGPVDLLVGHSLGGIVAAALAGQDPGAARAVVLEDPPGRMGDGAAEALAAGVETDARLVRDDRERLVRREREANPTWADEDVQHSVDGIAAADASAVAAGLRGHLVFDLTALVAAVPVPLLVLAGRVGDGFLEGRAGALQGPDREAVRVAVGPERFVAFDGGHCLHRDLPGRWLAEVGGFAEAVLPRGQGTASGS
ncbi:MAG TPA: alpha/beta hydrolase [Actinomycetota bacterium]|nr:alpha/beta hydrolase [Actinomycetota bacterium]